MLTGNESPNADIYSLMILAAQGDSNAQYTLGMLCLECLGVEQDYTKAAKWLKKAAECGHTEAQLQLGNLYTEGLGVEQDYKKAKAWYEKAAYQGHAGAQ